MNNKLDEKTEECKTLDAQCFKKIACSKCLADELAKVCCKNRKFKRFTKKMLKKLYFDECSSGSDESDTSVVDINFD